MRRRWMSVALASLMAATVATISMPVLGATSFEDVPDDHIFASDIEWLAAEGITQGCNPPENSRFCPDDVVTRGQMAAFLVRALHLTEGGPTFTDTTGSVFEADISRLAQAGITRGCNPPENSRFCPNDAVTRGQMAAFLVRALNLTEGGPTFTDTAGHVFEADISRMAQAGITRGCNPPENSRFCPDDAVTRGQMAAFLNRGLAVLAPFESTAVAAGNTHTCAVATDGAPWCWGRNGDGQLGNGSTTESALPVPVADAPTSDDVVAGGFHSCLLAADGAAWCWGLNANGQLGSGNRTDSSVPVRVVGGHTFASIDSGRNHVCGLESDGTAWCWGFNANGQLATGDVDSRTTPVEIAGHTFSAIVAGDEHTCGLDTAGTAWCWGQNVFGQLGDGTGVHRQFPVEVAGGRTFSAIAAGADHTCGLDTDGKAWCWGDNDRGQLGDGTSDTDREAPVAVAGDHQFVAISSGDEHTCAIASGGAGWCWGADAEGRLGDGAPGGEALVPVPVAGNQDYTSVTAGGRHSCAIDADGGTWCWGWNGYGQLGDGSETDHAIPASVRANG